MNKKIILLYVSTAFLGMVAIVLFVLCLFACCRPARSQSARRARPAAVASGWLISQVRGLERPRLSVCPSGIKYGPLDRGIYFVSKAPQWKLYKYSCAEKKYWLVNKTAMEAKRSGAEAPLPVADIGTQVPARVIPVLRAQAYIKGEAVTIAGLSARKFLSPRGRDTSEILLADAIKLPTAGSAACDYIFDTPTAITAANRILLRRRILTKSGQSTTFLDTLYARQMDMADCTFKVPDGYSEGK